MFDSKDSWSSKVLSLAIVTALLFTAFCVVPSDTDASEYPSGQTYTINLFEGERFTYVPGVNLTVGTTTFYVSGPASITNQVVGAGTSHMTVNFTAPAQETTYQPLKVTAQWVADEDENMDPQEIFQNIVFKTYLKPHFSSEEEGGVVTQAGYTVSEDTEPGTVIDTITLSGTGAQIVSVSVKDDSNEDTNDILAEVDGTGKIVTISTGANPLSVGDSYRIVLNATATVGTSSDTQSQSSINTVFSADVFVGGDVTLNPNHFVAYQGEGVDDGEGNTVLYKTLNVRPDNMTDQVIIVESSSNTDVLANGPVGENGLAFITNGAEFTGNSLTVTFVLRLQGMNGNEPVDTTFDCSLKLYGSQAFMEPPVIDTFDVYHATSDTKSVTALATVSGATYAEFSWGDGTPKTTVYSEDAEGTISAASHVYTASSMFKVTVTAYNDYGSVVRSVWYSTMTGGITDDPMPIISVTEVTMDEVKYVKMDASGSLNTTSYAWYNGSTATGTPISTNAILYIEKSAWTPHDVYTLKVISPSGATQTYTYDFSQQGHEDQPTPEPAKKEVNNDWLLPLIIGTLILVAALVAWFFFGIQIPVVLVVGIIGLVTAIVSASKYFGLF